MSDAKKFEHWAVVELFGHQRIAGLVTEAQVGGGSFIRVDVPELEKTTVRQGDFQRTAITQPAMTKYFGPAAIYAIHPCTEEIARQAAASIESYRDPMPVAVPALREPAAGKKVPAMLGPGGEREEWEEDDEP